MKQTGQSTRTQNPELGTRTRIERQIELQHYAMFREARGQSSETVTTMSETPRELFEELGLEEVFPLDERRLRVALNEEFAVWDDPLESGDTVVFLAPASGG